MEETVAINKLVKTYPRENGKRFAALNSIDLIINKGEIFGLLGPNGAGKTTLISILTGIIAPDSGTARILGMDCIGDTKKIQKQINIVSGFTGAPYSLSLDETLMYYCLLYNVKNPKEKINEVVKMVGLEEVRSKSVEDYSSGMKQRYSIAKGLLNDPLVLILDEPTVGLDIESSINIRNIIRALHKEGVTIILTTHNLIEAEELCDRVAFIRSGKIIGTGTADELKKKIVGKREMEIHCSNEKSVLEALRKVSGASAETAGENIVRVSVENNRTKEILRAISNADGDILLIDELEPSLEEIYLKFMRGGKDE